jgi:HK97 family phage prohead protease
MNKLRDTATFYTKEAPADLKQKRTFDFKFHAAPENMLKEIGDDLPDGYVAGWASTEAMDHVRDVVRPGAFDKAIREKGLEGPGGIKLLHQHRPSEIAGRIVKLEQRPQGLWIEAELNLKVSYVRDLYENAKMAGGLNFSIGYRLVEGGFKFIDLGEDSFWELTEVDLFEVSIVTFPCNDDAKMTFIKSEGDDPFASIAEFEKALVACGLAKSRNEANRVTRWVKGLEPTKKPAPKDQPVSASTMKSLGSVTEKLAELRKTLSAN